MLRTILVVMVVLNLFLAACSNNSKRDVAKATRASPLPSVEAETDSRWFDLILRSHPRREINTDLIELVRTKKVRIEFVSKPNSKSVLSVKQESNGSCLLTVNKFYFKFETKQERSQAYIYLRHEYEHITQLRLKRWPKNDEIAAQYRRTQNISLLQAKEWGRAAYRAEVEAYQKGCELADELHFSGDDYCDTKNKQGELAFRLMVAKATADSTIAVPGVPEAIKEAWEEDKQEEIKLSH